jgi:hypothetical protein
MAGIAVRAIIYVAAHSLVVAVGAAARMATAGSAGEDRKIRGILMARTALRPSSAMRSGIYREIRSVMIERCRCPSLRRVTGLARGRETGTRMIRIRRGIVVGQMAEVARRGRVQILAIDMALDAVDGRVRAGQRKRRGGMIER